MTLISNNLQKKSDGHSKPTYTNIELALLLSGGLHIMLPNLTETDGLNVEVKAVAKTLSARKTE